MVAIQKRFRVKNGLYVNEGAEISGTLSASLPLNPLHAATKSYIDDIALAEISSTEPVNPNTGKMWVDTNENRLKIYSGYSWITLATIQDTNNLQNHVHDDAIEGHGRIVQIITGEG